MAAVGCSWEHSKLAWVCVGDDGVCGHTDTQPAMWDVGARLRACVSAYGNSARCVCACAYECVCRWMCTLLSHCPGLSGKYTYAAVLPGGQAGTLLNSETSQLSPRPPPQPPLPQGQWARQAIKRQVDLTSLLRGKQPCSAEGGRKPRLH